MGVGKYHVQEEVQRMLIQGNKEVCDMKAGAVTVLMSLPPGMVPIPGYSGVRRLTGTDTRPLFRRGC